jgi:hypothetical protein
VLSSAVSGEARLALAPTCYEFLYEIKARLRCPRRQRHSNGATPARDQVSCPIAHHQFGQIPFAGERSGRGSAVRAVERFAQGNQETAGTVRGGVDATSI